MTVRLSVPGDLVEFVDRSPLLSSELYISSAMVDAFCQLSGDRQGIHRQRGNTPAIVPGNMVIALIPQMLKTTFQIESFSHCYTGRYESIRFLMPLRAEQSIALQVQISDVRVRKYQTFVTQHCAVQCNNADVATLVLTDVYFTVADEDSSSD